MILALKTLPSLVDLKIDIKTPEESMNVLTTLPKLLMLNGTPTKGDGGNIVIDLDDPETTDISLDNEKPIFTEIYSVVSEKLKSINQEEGDLFLQQFETLLKNEISKINKCVEINSPNYIYATNVLDSVLKILNYFNNKLLTFLKLQDEDNANIIEKITDHFFKTSMKLINIITKLNPKIEEETAKLKQKANTPIQHQYIPENDAQGFEEKIKTIKKEKDLIIQQFQDEITIYQTKIERLENENKMMTQKLLQNAKSIINQNVNSNNMFNSPSNMNIEISKHNSQTQLKKNKFTSSLTGSSPNNGVMINNNNQVNNRVFTLKMMKDTIYEIYNSKVEFNKKCDENQQPRETMEQHMYTFLNHKYGLKSIIIEWATNIINGIRTFSTEDTEVCLFGKILRNELEEDARLFLPMLKTNISNLLVMILKRQYPFKLMSDITALKNSKMNGTLTADECREIIYNLYDEQDAQYLEGKINEIIEKNRASVMASLPIGNIQISKKKKMTRDEIILLEQQKEESSNCILFRDCLRLLHEFQIKSREKYLRNFVLLFKRVDLDNNGILNEEEFIQFVQSLNIYTENFEGNVGRLLSIIDPYSNKQITFSECVSLFSMETIIDKKNGEMTMLDKICIGEIIDENDEQEL